MNPEERDQFDEAFTQLYKVAKELDEAWFPPKPWATPQQNDS